MDTPRDIPRIVLGSSLALALGCLPACKSPGYEKGDVAALSMRKAALEVQAESRALDQTAASLNALINEPAGDLRPAFTRYSLALDGLIAGAERTKSTGKRMQAKSAVYLETWSRELHAIDYGHIREVSDARWAEVTNRVQAVNQRYQDSQTVVQPLISYLVDIRTALRTDLTSAGLNSMKEVVENAQTNVAKVQVALDALNAELTNSSARLSSVAYVAPSHPGPTSP